MARLVAAAVTAVLLLAGCGGGADERRPDTTALRFLPADADAVAALSLDYGGADWSAIKRRYARLAGRERTRDLLGFDGPLPPTLDGALNLLAGFGGVTFADDLRPLLGGTAYLAIRQTPRPPLSRSAQDVLERLDETATRFGPRGPAYVDRRGRRLPGAAVHRALTERDRARPATEAVVAYTVPEPAALERLLDGLQEQGLERRRLRGTDAVALGDGVAVAGGRTVVAVLDPGARDARAVLHERLTARRPGPAPPGPSDALVAVRLRPDLLGAVLDRAQLRRALRESQAGRALRGLSARLDVTEDEVRVDGRLDFEGLTDEQLPVGASSALELPAGEPIASAASDQRRTTTFLSRLARELLPDSRFVRRVRALERATATRFDDEVLEAFEGASLTLLRPAAGATTTFAARSSLRDPERMRALLPRIAPRLPGILEALQGLGATGLTGLLLVAPDAPLVPEAASFLAAVGVRRLPEPAKRPGRPLLFEVRGLDPGNRQPGPDRLVYGVVGDAFVVGSTRALALRAAKVPTTGARRSTGALLRADVRSLARALGADAATATLLAQAFRGVQAEARSRDGDVAFSVSAR